MLDVTMGGLAGCSVNTVSAEPGAGLFAFEHGTTHEPGAVTQGLKDKPLSFDTKLLQHQGDTSTWESCLFGSSGDRSAVQDQNTGRMLSTAQLGASLDPVHDGPQQMPSTTVWLTQDTQQPATVLLAHQPIAQQQPTAPMSWGLPAQGLQVSAGTGASPAQLSPPGLNTTGCATCAHVGALQDQNMVILQQHVSTPLTSTVPVVLQVQGPADQGMQQVLAVQSTMQPAQQMYVLPSGEQVLCVSDNNHAIMPQHVLACVNPQQGNGSHGDLQVQGQHLQLQLPMQHVTTDNTVVQWVVSSPPELQQHQDLQAVPGYSVQVTKAPGSSPMASQPDTPVLSAPMKPSCPHKPGQLCSCSMGSPGGSFAAHDSMNSGSWHCLDSLCSSSSNSSPSVGVQNRNAITANTSSSRPWSSSGMRYVERSDWLTADGIMVSSMPVGPGCISYTQGLSSVTPGMGVVILSTPPAPQAVAAGLQAANGGMDAAVGTYMDFQGPVLMGNSLGQPSCMAPSYPMRRMSGNPCAFPHRPARFGKADGPPLSRPKSKPGVRSGGVQPVVGVRQVAADRAARSLSQAAAAGGKPQESEGASAFDKKASSATGDAPWAQLPLEEGLKQLWSGEQLQRAQGGRLFNVQQLAWHPIGEPDPCPQDLYNFQKLKRVVQKLDAVHKTRVKLIKRIHAVADHGESDLKSVYREVRCLVGEMLHDSAMHIKSLDECRVAGLVRLALMLQCALEAGPKEPVGMLTVV